MSELVNTMAAKAKRTGNTVTFSISVDEETQRFLKREAKRRFGGNVSALIAALVREGERKNAARRLLVGAKITDDERTAFRAESLRDAYFPSVRIFAI